MSEVECASQQWHRLLADSSLAGQEHGRTIPLADISGSGLLPRKLTDIPT
jgi:hypothetical protein